MMEDLKVSVQSTCVVTLKKEDFIGDPRYNAIINGKITDDDDKGDELYELLGKIANEKLKKINSFDDVVTGAIEICADDDFDIDDYYIDDPWKELLIQKK